MAKVKMTCHICSEVVKSEMPPEFCPKCGTNFADPMQETIIKQTHCQYSNARNLPGNLGNLYLTNQRLLWVNSSTSLSYGGGLVGSLITAHQKWGGSLPLANIQSFEDSKFGLFVKAFIVLADDGFMIKLSAKPKDEWIDAILKAKERCDSKQ
jgi:Nin one binding (NOB1) Zn-ribbon like.